MKTITQLIALLLLGTIALPAKTSAQDKLMSDALIDLQIREGLTDEEIIKFIEEELDIHSSYENVSLGGAVESMANYSAKAGQANNLQCATGRVWGCRDNIGCANASPKQKSCTATQKGTLVNCVYTITVYPSECNSKNDCWCQIKTETTIDRFSTALGCPPAGTQTATCVPK